MGPQRQNWTFPYTGQQIVDAIKKLEAQLATDIDNKLDDEQLYEQELAAFREQMRQAGVNGWDRIQLPDETRRYTGQKARNIYSSKAKKLIEATRYRKALEHDIERDPHRTFKLTFDDLEFLGL